LLQKRKLLFRSEANMTDMRRITRTGLIDTFYRWVKQGDEWPLLRFDVEGLSTLLKLPAQEIRRRTADLAKRYKVIVQSFDERQFYWPLRGELANKADMIEAALREDLGVPLQKETGLALELYWLPQDFAVLRHTIETRAQQLTPATFAAETLTQTPSAPLKGRWAANSPPGKEQPHPLASSAISLEFINADNLEAHKAEKWGLTQLALLEREITALDLTSYWRGQPVYLPGSQGRWYPAFTEYSANLDSLLVRRFPQRDISPTHPLYPELCRLFDKKTLSALLASRVWRSQPVSINLTPKTVLGEEFKASARQLPVPERARIIIEMAQGEILRDVRASILALKQLKQLGFGSAIDALTLDTLPYVQLARFEADYYKLRFERDKLAHIALHEAIESLFTLPRGKIILSHCQEAAALALGKTLGIGLYQGWLIDRLARGEREKARQAPFRSWRVPPSPLLVAGPWR
jgi:EAL domain-containing protein (putative c-di-GMP-specific phosphodiesterase class I)